MKNRIGCHDTLKLKEDFFDQKLPYDKMAEIDSHLESCEQCRKEYESFEKSLLDEKSNDASYDFSKFEYALTLKMIGKTIRLGAIAISVWYILACFVFPFLFSNHIYAKSEKARIALSDLVAFTMPTYSISNYVTQSGPWNHNIKIELKRASIHKEEYAGYIDAAVPMYIGESDMKLVDVHKSGKRYLLPSQLYYKSKGRGGVPDKIAEKLSSFADGTITQFSLSFNRPINAVEIDKLIKTVGGADNCSHKCWVAVDTGIDMSNNGNVFINYRNPISGDLWGFPLVFFNNKPVPEKISEEKSISSDSGIQFDTRCQQSSENFKKEMKLFEENSVYLDDTVLTNEIKRINKYLSQNEITFYGAVLVAPTKNIFNLKDIDYIGDMQIIDVQFDY